MSIDLRPEFIVAIKRGQKTVATVAAFAMEEWQGEGWRPGLYRVKAGASSWVAAGARWMAEPGQGMSFYDVDGCMALARELAAKALGWPEAERRAWPPDLPRGSRVRVALRAPDPDAAQAAAEDPEDAVLAELAGPCTGYVLGFTSCEPFQDAGGAWWTRLVGRREPVRCGDCEVVG